MKPSYIIAGISILLNMLFIVYLFSSKPAVEKIVDQKSRINQFPFLSKRIFIEDQNDILINFVPLRTLLNSYVSNLDNRTGVYFEYLPTGNSIGVQEKETFISASLLKLPLVMAVYKKIEENKSNKNSTIILEKKYLDSGFGDLWKEELGKKMKLIDVIKITLQNSDNTAARMLFKEIEGKDIEMVFNSLDIPIEVSGGESVVTPKNYTSILRSLYLSSYLKEEYSNEILSLLTHTKFDDKLKRNIPKNIPVAHKIGNAYRGNDTNKYIYTDCGIIFVPKRPYALCIMTQTNEDKANKIFSELGKITYDYVSSANK